MRNIASNLGNRITRKIREPIEKAMPFGSYEGGNFSEAECIIYDNVLVGVNIELDAGIHHLIYWETYMLLVRKLVRKNNSK